MGTDDAAAATDDDQLPARMGAPARRALEGLGVTRLSQVATWREQDLAALHGMGPKALSQLRVALGERGLSFAD